MTFPCVESVRFFSLTTVNQEFLSIATECTSYLNLIVLISLCSVGGQKHAPMEIMYMYNVQWSNVEKLGH